MTTQPSRPGPAGRATASRPAVPAPRSARPEPLLAPGEVAAMFGVDAKTVSRWERTGRLTCVRTLGGHRRFPRAQVEELLARTRVQRRS